MVASITTNEELQYIIGAILVVAVGAFLLYDRILNTDTFAALVGTYGVTSIAAGLHLMETTSGISKFWKYVGIIVVSSAEFGLAYFASLNVLSIVSVAAGIIAIATFFVHDLQHYAPELPSSFVNNSALIAGGVIAVAQAVESQSPTSLQAVFIIILTAALMYIYSQFIPEPIQK
jgi:hypothetical protein